MPALRNSSTSLKSWRVMPPSNTILTRAFADHRHRARKRDLPFTLTREQFCALVSQPCTYCGGHSFRNHFTTAKLPPEACNGVDRIDSSAGYTPANSVPCCATCNRAKSDMPVTAFISWLFAIRQYKAECALPQRNCVLCGSSALDNRNAVFCVDCAAGGGVDSALEDGEQPGE